jgi:hypothetical protein
MAPDNNIDSIIPRTTALKVISFFILLFQSKLPETSYIL